MVQLRTVRLRAFRRFRLVVLALVAILGAALLSAQLPATAAPARPDLHQGDDSGNRVPLPAARPRPARPAAPKDVRARPLLLPAAGSRTVPVRPGGAAVPASPFT